MTLDPARPEKTRRGVWGGVAPPVGLGFGMRPPPGSGSARNTRSGSARNTPGRRAPKIINADFAWL